MTNDMRKLMEAIDRINENEQTCLRCGTDLFSKEDLLTGICPNCWDSKKDGDVEESVEVIDHVLREYSEDDSEEIADELEDIKEQISSLIYSAGELVDQTDERDAARAYWIGHILGALDNESGYIGGSMTTMQDSIDAIREGNEDEDEDEDEWDTEPAQDNQKYKRH